MGIERDIKIANVQFYMQRLRESAEFMRARRRVLIETAKPISLGNLEKKLSSKDCDKKLFCSVFALIDGFDGERHPMVGLYVKATGKWYEHVKYTSLEKVFAEANGNKVSFLAVAGAWASRSRVDEDA